MYEYTAFISYRHKPLDQAIADRLQKLLERFRPPGELKRKPATQVRIFRDRTELPTSNDLDLSLREALASSEYLIVILSEEYQESQWCMEELREFKRLCNGKSNRIIPVLVSGEPEIVVPEDLRVEKIVTVQSDGTVLEERREIEPLCCDVRADSIKRSLHLLESEYLRIEAVLLKCRFDDLYRRHERRKRQAFASASGIVLLVMAVILSVVLVSRSRVERANTELTVVNGKLATVNAALENTNNKLSETNAALAESEERTRVNAQRAFINESRYLAGISKELLDEDDRFGAISVALSALPSEQIDRPLTEEAVSALAEAVNPYKLKLGYELIGKISATQKSGLTEEGACELDPERKLIITAEESDGNLKVYNADTLVEIGRYSMDDADFNTHFTEKVSYPQNARLLSRHRVLFFERKGFSCYDYLTGEKKWKKILNERTPNDRCVSEDGSKIAYGGSGNGFFLLDTDTGVEKSLRLGKEKNINDIEENITAYIGPKLEGIEAIADFSSSGNLVAAMVNMKIDSDSESNELRKGFAFISPDDGGYYVYQADYADELSSDQVEFTDEHHFYFVSADKSIVAIDALNGTKLWEKTEDNYMAVFRLDDFPESEGNRSTMLCLVGDQSIILVDSETGLVRRKISKSDLSDSDFVIQDPVLLSDNKGVYFRLSNLDACIYLFDEELMVNLEDYVPFSYSAFLGNSESFLFFDRGEIFVFSPSDIRQFNLYNDYNIYRNQLTSPVITPKYTVIESGGLLVIDGETGGTIQLSDTVKYDKILGLTKDNCNIYFCGETEKKSEGGRKYKEYPMMKFSFETGVFEEFVFPDTTFLYSVGFGKDCIIDNELFYVRKGLLLNGVYRWRIGTEKGEPLYELDERIESYKLCNLEDGEHILFVYSDIDGNCKGVIINPYSMQVVELTKQLSNDLSNVNIDTDIRHSPDGRHFAFRKKRRINVVSSEGELISVINNDIEDFEFGFSCDKNSLIIIDEEGGILEYDYMTGNILSKTDAVNSMLLYSSPSEKWINDDNISVLYQSRYRNLIIVKNRIFWPLPDAVNKAYYDPFNGTGSSYTILRIPFFSLENLVDRGLKLTKGYFMSDWKKYTLNIN